MTTRNTYPPYKIVGGAKIQEIIKERNTFLHKTQTKKYLVLRSGGGKPREEIRKRRIGEKENEKKRTKQSLK